MIHVATATDAKYWPYLPRLLNSIVNHASQAVTVHLLVRGLPEAKSWATAHTSDRLTIHVIEVEEFLDGVHLHTGGRITRSTMDRLLLPRLLPEVPRLVYLDIDLTVRADLATLLQHDAGPTGLAARPAHRIEYATLGPQLKSWGHRNQEAILASVDPHWPCFNAGVLLMDLERLREHDFSGRTIQLAHEFGVNDQVAATIYAAGRFATLDPAWNVYVGQAHETIRPWRIVHWAGPEKPWSPSAALRKLWWEVPEELPLP